MSTRTSRASCAITGLLVGALLAAACSSSSGMSKDDATEVVAALEEGEATDQLTDAMASADAAEVVAQAVVDRIRAGVAAALSPPDPNANSEGDLVAAALNQLRDDPLLAAVDRVDDAPSTWPSALAGALAGAAGGRAADEEQDVGDVSRELRAMLAAVLYELADVRALVLSWAPADQATEADLASFANLRTTENITAGIEAQLLPRLVPSDS